MNVARMLNGKSATARVLHAYMVKDIDPVVYVRGMFFALKRGDKIPAKSAQAAPSHCDHHMFTNCRVPTAHVGKTRRRG